MGLNNLLIQKAKKKRFNIIQGKTQIDTMIDRLPEDGECFKFLSDGGFSSICFVLFVADRTRIKNLHVSSFRVGKKDIQVMHLLKKKGVLDYAEFALCQFAKDELGGAFSIVKTICDEHSWKIHTLDNHSKVHLYDTSAGKFVLETSSNLNENPKIEQFSFEKDADLYDFYMQNMFKGG